MSAPDLPTAPRLELVVAVAENGVIGRDGDLPWRLPGDLRHFKRLTTGHTLLMGRKTWDSLGGRPLPKRRHLVLSRDPDFVAAAAGTGAEGFGTLEEALRAASNDPGERVFVIGGRDVFAATLPQARDLHLTRVHAEVEGDVTFPDLDLRDWRLEERARHDSDDRHAHPFSIEHWRREDEALAAEPMTCDAVGWPKIRALLEGFDLELHTVDAGRPIPATYWGEPEAGIRGRTVYARGDTPIHSLLHEAAHALLASRDAGSGERPSVDVDAHSDQAEEDAVCLLQVELAPRLGVSRERVMADMDAWGYSFLDGATADFVARGADAARAFLAARGLGPAERPERKM